MRNFRLIIAFLVLVNLLAAGSAFADPGSLQQALDTLAAGPDPVRLNLPPTPERLVALMTQNGRLAELNLTPAEGMIYAKAILARLGVSTEPRLPLPLLKTPPANDIRTPGEFEPLVGIIIRYPLDASFMRVTFNAMIAALAGDPDFKVYILVNNATQENTVRNVLENQSIPTDHLVFYYISTESVWTRDYGPIFLEEMPDGADSFQSMIDMNYFYAGDDPVPGKLADLWDMSMYFFDIDFEGGNYMSDGAGTCFTSTGLTAYNPGWTYAEIAEGLDQYFGCAKHIMPQPLIGEGTTHIDMFSKLLDPTTIIVGEYEEGDDNYQRMEDVAALYAGSTNLAGDPFTVLRIPMPPVYEIYDPYYGYMDIFRSYTNSLIVNNKVLVPIYNIDMDADGLAVYEDFYADKDMEVVPIDSEAIIEWLGAVHCVAMERSAAGASVVADDDDDDDNDTADDDDASPTDDDDDTSPTDDDDDASPTDDDDASPSDDDAGDDDDASPTGDDDDDDDDDSCGC